MQGMQFPTLNKEPFTCLGRLCSTNVQGYFRYKNADLLGDVFSLKSYDFLFIQ